MKNKIIDATIELINKGSDLSVRTITKAAGIERSTYYAYYSNVQDVIEKAEERVIEVLKEIEEDLSLDEYLNTLFNFFNENKRDIYALLVLENRYSLYEKLTAAIKEYFIKEDKIDEIKLKLISLVITNEFLSYIKDDSDIDLEKLKEILLRIEAI